MTGSLDLRQLETRPRFDDGDEDTATFFTAANTKWQQTAASVFRVRFVVQEAGGKNSSSNIFQIQYSKNNGSWLDVSASSPNIHAASSAFVNDGDPTNDQIGGSGNFVAGEHDVQEGATDTGILVQANRHTEIEYCLILENADVADGDDFKLRLSPDTDPLTIDATAEFSALTVTVVVSGATVLATPAAIEIAAGTPTLVAGKTVKPAVQAITFETVTPVIDASPTQIDEGKATRIEINTQILSSAAPTGITDSQKGTIFLDFLVSATGINQVVYAHRRFDIVFQPNMIPRIGGANSAGTSIFTITGAVTTAQKRHTMLGSWNLGAATTTASLYMDDNDVLNIGTYVSGSSIALDVESGGKHGAIGATIFGGDEFDGAIRAIWLTDATAIDFSVEANRRKFIDAKNCFTASDLGTSGESVYGEAPPIYVLGSGEAILRNRGGDNTFVLASGAASATAWPPFVILLPDESVIEIGAIAPAISVASQTIVTPSVGSIELVVNNVSIQTGASIQPGPATLELFLNNPLVSTGASVQPNQAVITIDATAPLIQTPIRIETVVSDITLEALAPSLAGGVQLTLTAAQLEILGISPNIFTGASVRPDVAAINLEAINPALKTGVTVKPGVPTLVLGALNPSISAAGQVNISIPNSVLTITPGTPSDIGAPAEEEAASLIYSIFKGFGVSVCDSVREPGLRLGRRFVSDPSNPCDVPSSAGQINIQSPLAAIDLEPQTPILAVGTISQPSTTEITYTAISPVVAGGATIKANAAVVSFLANTPTITEVEVTPPTFASLEPMLWYMPSFQGAYLQRTTDLSGGVVNGPDGSIFIDVAFDGTAGASEETIIDGNGKFLARRLTDGTINIQAFSSAGVTALDLDSATTYAASGRHTIMGSWDASASSAHLYIDNAEDRSLVTLSAGVKFDYTPGSWYVAAKADASDKLTGALRRVWLHDKFIDFSVTANRDLMVDGSNEVKDIRATGIELDGNRPMIFLNNQMLAFHQNNSDKGHFEWIRAPDQRQQTVYPPGADAGIQYTIRGTPLDGMSSAQASAIVNPNYPTWYVQPWNTAESVTTAVATGGVINGLEHLDNVIQARARYIFRGNHLVPWDSGGVPSNQFRVLLPNNTSAGAPIIFQGATAESSGGIIGGGVMLGDIAAWRVIDAGSNTYAADVTGASWPFDVSAFYLQIDNQTSALPTIRFLWNHESTASVIGASGSIYVNEVDGSTTSIIVRAHDEVDPTNLIMGPRLGATFSKSPIGPAEWVWLNDLRYLNGRIFGFDRTVPHKEGGLIGSEVAYDDNLNIAVSFWEQSAVGTTEGFWVHRCEAHHGAALVNFIRVPASGFNASIGRRIYGQGNYLHAAGTEPWTHNTDGHHYGYRNNWAECYMRDTISRRSVMPIVHFDAPKSAQSGGFDVQIRNIDCREYAAFHDINFAVYCCNIQVGTAAGVEWEDWNRTTLISGCYIPGSGAPLRGWAEGFKITAPSGATIINRNHTEGLARHIDVGGQRKEPTTAAGPITATNNIFEVIDSSQENIVEYTYHQASDVDATVANSVRYSGSGNQVILRDGATFTSALTWLHSVDMDVSAWQAHTGGDADISEKTY